MHFVNKPIVHILTIILFTFLSYANTFDVPFQLDDIDNIVSSPAIKNFDYFSDHCKIDDPGNTDTFDKPLFKTRYIGYLTFALNYSVHGLNVGGYHLVNILIHLCTSLLLYSLIILTFRTPRLINKHEDHIDRVGSISFIAFFTALLFAVHPLQTQAVTYIVQRFASLATMLWLLSLVSYIQFRLLSGQFKRSALFFIALVSAVFAMKTKEFAMLLPITVVMYELMFLDGSMKKRLCYFLPFCLTMAIVPLSLLSTSASKIGESATKISGAYGGISRLDYLLTQFRVIVTYIRLLLFPVRQRFDYDYPIYRSFFSIEVVISALFLLIIFLTGVYLYQLSRTREGNSSHLYRLASFGIFWFFITVSAESSVIPIADVIFEHRLYLPSIGFFIVLVTLVELTRKRWRKMFPLLAKLSVALMLLLVAGSSIATYKRNNLWRDRIGFMEDEVKKSPGKARVRNLLGCLYGEQGRFTEALYHLRAAIAADPKYSGAYYNLGVTYMKLGRLSEAENEYKNTIALRFNSADAHSNLGSVYAKQGFSDAAIREYTTAIMLSPQSVITRNNLGNIYMRQSRFADAVREYQETVRIKPDFAEAHYNLGNAFTNLGRIDEAKSVYREALRLKPDFIEARRQLEK